MKTFDVLRDYHDIGADILAKDRLTIYPGLTVLVGCNGAGKSTLIHQLSNILETENIPWLEYNNLQDGGHHAMGWATFQNQYSKVATMALSSEGENIIINFGDFAKKIGELVRKQESGSSVWVFMDALDSGMSIDNIVEVKDFFKFVKNQDPDKEFYFIVAANEYEMARGETCFDVNSGEYIAFADYEDFRLFILESRKLKDKRRYKKRSR